MRILFLCILIFISSGPKAREYKLAEDTVIFPGRVSKINPAARLVRIRINFENSKFISKNNRIEIWNESLPEKKCLAYAEGRTSDYLLVRIPKFDQCSKTVYLSVGSYIHMYSPDLEKNLVTAIELNEILHRKRTALGARLQRHKRDVNGYEVKIDVVNKRYEVLKQKLELEWQNELLALEEDKTRSYKNYKKTQAQLHELEYKMQQYRVRDQNMIEDRWSLDPKLYYKK